MSLSSQAARINNVFTQRKVSGSIASARMTRLGNSNEFGAEPNSPAIVKAGGFDKGTVAISVRNGNPNDEYQLFDHLPMTSKRDADPPVFSGVGGLALTELGINMDYAQFVEAMATRGIGEAAAEKIWNDYILSRIQPVGVAQEEIKVNGSDQMHAFSIDGTVSIPAVVPVHPGQRLRYRLPTKAEARAFHEQELSNRTYFFNPLRGQLTVEPVEDGNESNCFLRDLLFQTSAPELFKQRMDSSHENANEMSPGLMYSQGMMDLFFNMLSTFLLKTGMILVRQEPEPVQNMQQTFTGAVGDMTTDNRAEFAGISELFYADAVNPTSYATQANQSMSVSNAIHQVGILAQLLLTNVAAGNDPNLTNVRTMNFLENITADQQKMIAEFKTDLFRTAHEAAFQRVRGPAEDSNTFRPDIKHVFGTMYDPDTREYSNPLLLSSGSYAENTVGNAAVKAIVASQNVINGVIAHQLERDRLNAGVAMGSARLGQLVPTLKRV